MIGRWPGAPPQRRSRRPLDLLADLSEILGEQSFRVARVPPRRRPGSATPPSSVAELALEGKAKELPGIGKTIEAKIVEVVETGDMEALAKRRAEVPGEVASFMRLPGLGPKTAARIWHELGVTTLAELKEAARGRAAAHARGPRRDAPRRRS